jgi:hypothetical protein
MMQIRVVCHNSNRPSRHIIGDGDQMPQMRGHCANESRKVVLQSALRVRRFDRHAMGHSWGFDLVPNFGARDAAQCELAGKKPPSLRREDDRAGESQERTFQTAQKPVTFALIRSPH